MSVTQQRVSRAMEHMEAYFDMLQRGFMFPHTVELGRGESGASEATRVLLDVSRISSAALMQCLHQGTKSDSSAQIYSLLHTQCNEAVHEYIENLKQLGSALSSLQCNGDAALEAQKKNDVNKVATERSRVESWIDMVCEAMAVLN